MAKKKVATKKPSGLKIERDGLVFTFSWKKGETYGDGQQLEYKLYEAPSQEVADSARNFLSQGFEISGTKWVPLSVSKTATSKSLTLSANSYYPAVVNSKRVEKRLYGIAFRVRGQAAEYTKSSKTYDPQWSDRVVKTMVIKPPKAPAITPSWDSNYTNRSTYTWTTENAGNQPATNVEYQTFPLINCPEDITGLSDWDSATSQTKTLNDSAYHDETGLSGISKTRCVRVRARGIGGYSKWSYAKFVFAAPLAGDITSAKAIYDPGTHLWNLTATWDTPQDAGHPVDTYMLQYRIGKPGANMAVTSDGSWTDTSPTTAGDISVQVTEALSDDECLWLRVVANYINHSGANGIAGSVVRAYTGKVAAPTNLSITSSSSSTHEVSISVTNNSGISDSKIALVFQPSSNPRESVIVDVLTGSGAITKSGIKCPDWSNTGTLGFRAFAYVGTQTYKTDSDSVKRYNVVPAMQSDDVFTGGGIPKAPAVITAIKSGTDIEVNWDWTWEDANGAEVSWANRLNAWESTDEPETHEVSATGPAHLFISDPGMGEVWYVRVRLFYDDGEDITYSAYSGVARVNMTEAPQVPTLDVSTDALKPGQDLTCSWTYVTMDGTDQAYAEVDEAVTSGGVTTYNEVARVLTAQHVTFVPGWAAGTQHALVVRVTSDSGVSSPWSDPVIVTAVTPPSCSISQASLVSAGAGYQLQALPLTLTVIGAGTAGQTTLEIIRLADFVEERPDEAEFNGFAGQVVTRRIYAGEAQQTITLDDITEGAHLDDTADYRIVATVTDGYRQTAQDSIDFTVAWAQQAVKPTATVAIVDTAAYITIGAKPAGAANTDTIDIYRISADPPVLIYRDANFGDVVVDPFPAIGELGGYRVVLKTKNGDYTTADGEFAWIDVDAGFETGAQYIDFGGYTLPLSYEVEFDSGWLKDFKTTKYLGGHEEGDWLAGVSRSQNVSAVLLTEDDVYNVRVLRQLANYSGPAHIRSKDGSSYNANIDVTKEGMKVGGGYRSLTLSIKATERAVLDGLLQADWEA